MSEIKKLETKHLKAIVAIMEYPTYGEAAKVLGISEKTLQRWREIPEFRIAMYQTQMENIDVALRPLIQLVPAAVGVLETALKSESRTLKDKRLAAQAVIDYALKLHDRVLDQRVAELEAYVYGN